MAITELRPRNVNFISINPYCDPPNENIFPCGAISEYPPGPSILGGVNWVDSQEAAFDRVAVVHNDPLRTSPQYVAKGVNTYSPRVGATYDMAVCAMDKRGMASLPYVAPRATYTYDYQSMPRYFLKNNAAPSIATIDPQQFDIVFTRKIKGFPAVGQVITNLRLLKGGSAVSTLSFVSYTESNRTLRVKRITGLFQDGETGYTVDMNAESPSIKNDDGTNLRPFGAIPIGVNIGYLYPVIGTPVLESGIRSILLPITFTNSSLVSIDSSKVSVTVTGGNPISGMATSGAQMVGNNIRINLNNPVQAGQTVTLNIAAGFFTDTYGAQNEAVSKAVTNGSQYIRPTVNANGARITNAQPARLEIDFSAAVSIDNTTVFTLTGPSGYTMPTISGIFQNNNTKIILTLSKPMEQGITGLSLSYTASAGHDVAEAIELVPGSNIPIANEINAPFAVESASIAVGSENIILLDFVQLVKNTSSTPTGFSVNGITISSVQITSGLDTDTMQVTLNRKVLKEETLTISYDGTGDLTIGTSGTPTGSFSKAVTNNSQLSLTVLTDVEMIIANMPSEAMGQITFKATFSGDVNATAEQIKNAMKHYANGGNTEIT
jgi:methionine-rich copper-binding protein CopC